MRNSPLAMFRTAWPTSSHPNRNLSINRRSPLLHTRWRDWSSGHWASTAIKCRQCQVNVCKIITCDLFDLFKAAKIMEVMTKINTLVLAAAPAVGGNLNFLVCLAGDRGLGNCCLRTWCPNCFVSCACVKSAKTVGSENLANGVCLRDIVSLQGSRWLCFKSCLLTLRLACQVNWIAFLISQILY